MLNKRQEVLPKILVKIDAQTLPAALELIIQIRAATAEIQFVVSLIQIRWLSMAPITLAVSIARRFNKTFFYFYFPNMLSIHFTFLLQYNLCQKSTYTFFFNFTFYDNCFTVLFFQFCSILSVFIIYEFYNFPTKLINLSS